MARAIARAQARLGIRPITAYVVALRLVHRQCVKSTVAIITIDPSRAPTKPIYVKIMVPSCVVRELYRLT